MSDTIHYNKNQDVGSIENLTEFNYLTAKPYLDQFTTGKSFIFITRPSLFLYPKKPTNSNDTDKVLAYENMCNDPTFTQYLLEECHNQSDKLIIEQLSTYADEFSDIHSSFMPIFTNLCTTRDLVDISTETMNGFSTRRGYNIMMPTRTEASRAASTLTLRMTETQNLDVIKMINLWVEYQAKITDGTFNANKTMIKNNILDYTCSIYVFVMEPNGKNIAHYSKYTGCYPQSAPHSAFGTDPGQDGTVDLSIPFVYTYYETMNPRILEDFNRVSLNMLTADSDDYSDQASESSVAYGTVDYIPITDSQLLNKDKLFNNTKYDIQLDERRDPIVYYEKKDNKDSANTDSLNGHYVLSFGKESRTNSRLKSIFDDVDPDLYDAYYGSDD